jgi:hypothetical protein
MPAQVKTLYKLSYYVDRMSPGQALCRARSRHDWPTDRIIPGQPLPGRVVTDRNPDRTYEVTEYCLDCGKESHWTSLAGGRWNANRVRRYGKDKDEVVIPREVEASSRDIRAIRMQAAQDTLFPRGK